MEIFTSSDVSRILRNRFVVVIGDSIQRGIYKDLVLLLQQNRYLSQGELKAKGEYCFLDDELIEGGRKGVMSNGVGYKEVRQYCQDEYLIRFYFVTRCYNNYMESILKDLKSGPQPDVIVMNSCLWDMTRYGKNSIQEYKENLSKLFERFYQSLPANCLFIWNTTLPISSKARGGFLVPEIEFMSTTLRLDILEANYFAREVAVRYGFDVLDLHFYLRHHLNCRVHDGVHWDRLAHRHITNLILQHICEAWNIPTPKHRPVTFGSYGSRQPLGGFNFPSNNYKGAGYQYPEQNPQFMFGQGLNQPAASWGSWEGPHFEEQHVTTMQQQWNVSPAFEWQPYQQTAAYGTMSRDRRHYHQPYSYRDRRFH